LVYDTRVSLAARTIRADGKSLSLTPGMAVTVEIKTGRRRVIDFLLSPLVRYRDEAIRER
jgi:hemolysin D